MTIATLDDNLPSPKTSIASAHLRALGVGRSVYRIIAHPAAILAVMTLLHATFILSFYAPAHGGTDQDGYHVTARLLADGKGASVRPASPFSFVGNMMVLTEAGRVYAKYPPGYPLLAAGARLVGGSSAVHLVNPVCTVAACAASFVLFRTVLGNFASLCAVLWLSWNPLVLFYANDGNSHASTLLCTIIGIWGVISWMKGNALWRGALGACCLGYGATIRYSECLLIAPVLFAAATRMAAATFSWRSRLRQSAAVLIAWAIPVGWLAGFCWCAFGAPWKTGYSYCAEETGFGWKYFIGSTALYRPGNWETLLVQMNWMGLFVLWPIGMAGQIALISARWREGIIIALWVAPSVALYLCYYWAPAGAASLGYLRFFESVIPGLILCAMWVIENGMSRGGAGGAVALGTITALGISVNLCNTIPSLESSLAGRQALARVSGFIHTRVVPGSTLFIADESLSNCLDAQGDYALFNLQLFRNASFPALNRIMGDPAKAEEPDPRQRARIALYWRLLGTPGLPGNAIPKSNEQLQRAQNGLLEGILRGGSRVFFLLRTGQNQDMLPDPVRWTSAVVDSVVCYPNVQVARPIGGGNPPLNAREGGPWFSGQVTWTIYQVSSRAASHLVLK